MVQAWDTVGIRRNVADGAMWDTVGHSGTQWDTMGQNMLNKNIIVTTIS